MSSFYVEAYWVNEKPQPAPRTFIDVDGVWWECVSHWGPVICTGISVFKAGGILELLYGEYEARRVDPGPV